MLVSIHQPHYLPWLRYLEKIAHSDVFIVLDNIQFNKNGWQNRNKLKSPQGETLLTVPVHAKAGQTLDEVRICNTVDWRRKHWRTIEQNYHRAPHFDRYASVLEDIYLRDWEFLNDLNRHMLKCLVDLFDLDTRIVYASTLHAPGTGTERLIQLIHAVGGDTYYSGAYALDSYLDMEQLDAAGIQLKIQEWETPHYPQLHGDFIPDLSVVDLLMNCGQKGLHYLNAHSHNPA